MFLLILLVTAPHKALARASLLITYFDAFSGARANNSEQIAKALKNELGIPTTLCELPTVFDKAFHQSRTCLENLAETPTLVIGLGETGCSLKIETIVKNLDRTYGPDNEGQEREGTHIIPQGKAKESLHYPWPQMYCALTPLERFHVKLSQDAGSFVCNNTAYQMRYTYPHLPYGFIHVPSHHCPLLRQKNRKAISKLVKMIRAGIKALEQNLQEDQHCL